ncbi:MAG: hypothetical protein ACJAW2_000443 [Shewanella sp.]|jgi:hypothetical protein
MAFFVAIASSKPTIDMRLVTKKIKRFTLLYAELSKYNYNKLASITG